MGLKYLLDTNICIYIAKHSPIHILHRFEELIIGQAAMSVVTYGELFYGVYKSQHSKKTWLFYRN